MADSTETDSNPAQIGNLRRLALPFLIYGFVGNLVILVSPLFMMQVLDRVVPSGNLNTLIMLLIFALAVLVLNAVVEFSRDRSLGRIVRWIDDTCIQPIVKQDPDTRSACLTDLQTLHGFFSGRHPVNLVALAWLPLFLVFLALINPLYLLLIALMFGTIFLVQTFASSWAKEPKSQIQDIQSRESATSYCLDQASRQIRADGAPQRMANQMLALRKNRLQLEDQTDAPTHFSAASSGALRLATQLFALSLGAYLVSQHMMTAGGMIAASVICGKVLSSLEGSIGSLREIGPARKAFANLQNLPVVNAQGLNLQAFDGKLICSGLIFPRGAGAPPRLDRITFELKSGECLAIIGDSGCGKTTLLNALSGISPAPIGLVQLDQTDIRHLDPVSREKVVGYTPQIPNFLNGTIAQNIAGFDPDATDAKVIAAAKLARSHGVFSSLKDGYHTDLSRDAFLLTTGQRQLLSLTAAVYQKPKYLFLDE
ncbi:MAG: ATP-binding cassette domain-containing protein, partial [Pseudomonadota bacterium]